MQRQIARCAVRDARRNSLKVVAVSIAIATATAIAIAIATENYSFRCRV
jgi:ABC-type spermidine/putrescine transport system permease subunit II